MEVSCSPIYTRVYKSVKRSPFPFLTLMVHRCYPASRSTKALPVKCVYFHTCDTDTASPIADKTSNLRQPQVLPISTRFRRPCRCLQHGYLPAPICSHLRLGSPTHRRLVLPDLFPCTDHRTSPPAKMANRLLCLSIGSCYTTYS